jgi:hypothetical protein
VSGRRVFWQIDVSTQSICNQEITVTALSQSTKRKLSLLQLADELGNVARDLPPDFRAKLKLEKSAFEGRSWRPSAEIFRSAIQALEHGTRTMRSEETRTTSASWV